MTNRGRLLVIAGATSVLLAGQAAAQLTDAEFKCESAASKALGKFVGAKTKCVSKCFQDAAKLLVYQGDCLPPYGGATLECLSDPVLGKKGAEDKFRNAIRRACDPTFKPGADCPECYSGGDCSINGEASGMVQTAEAQIDSTVPGVACERAGATPDEQKCELNTGKALAKLAAGILKCYDKCHQAARKGQISEDSCSPPTSDPESAACVSAANGKAIASIDKLCGDIGADPDDCGVPYPTGADWANLIEIAISGNIPSIYCE